MGVLVGVDPGAARVGCTTEQIEQGHVRFVRTEVQGGIQPRIGSRIDRDRERGAVRFARCDRRGHVEVGPGHVGTRIEGATEGGSRRCVPVAAGIRCSAETGQHVQWCGIHAQGQCGIQPCIHGACDVHRDHRLIVRAGRGARDRVGVRTRCGDRGIERVGEAQPAGRGPCATCVGRTSQQEEQVLRGVAVARGQHRIRAGVGGGHDVHRDRSGGGTTGSGAHGIDVITRNVRGGIQRARVGIACGVDPIASRAQRRGELCEQVHVRIDAAHGNGAGGRGRRGEDLHHDVVGGGQRGCSIVRPIEGDVLVADLPRQGRELGRDQRGRSRGVHQFGIVRERGTGGGGGDLPGFGAQEGEIELHLLAHAHLQGIAQVHAAADRWDVRRTGDGGENEVLVVQPVDPIVQQERAVVERSRLIGARELDVVGAVAAVGAHGGRGTTEPRGTAGSAARGPFHFAVAEAHVLPDADHRVRAVGHDQLERVVLVHHAAVVAHVHPVHVQRGGCHLVPDLTTAGPCTTGSARVHIGPERRHHVVAPEATGGRCREARGRETSEGTAPEGHIAVVVDVAGGVQIAVQVEGERQEDGARRLVIVRGHGQGVGGIRLDPAIAGAAATAFQHALHGLFTLRPFCRRRHGGVPAVAGGQQPTVLQCLVFGWLQPGIGDLRPRAGTRQHPQGNDQQERGAEVLHGRRLKHRFTASATPLVPVYALGHRCRSLQVHKGSGPRCSIPRCSCPCHPRGSVHYWRRPAGCRPRNTPG